MSRVSLIGSVSIGLAAVLALTMARAQTDEAPSESEKAPAAEASAPEDDPFGTPPPSAEPKPPEADNPFGGEKPFDAQDDPFSLAADVYAVRDLVGGEDYDSLIELIVATVAPNSWDEVGGPASVSSFNGTLVISQTQDVHREIADLLKQLRQVRKPGGEDNYAPIPLSSREPWQSPLKKKLAERTTWEFVDTPLSDVVHFIRDAHDLPIMLDERALEDLGIPKDIPINSSLKNISLESALRLMLRDLDLRFVLRDEVVLITTPEQAEELLSTAIYPVHDLLELPEEASAEDVQSELEKVYRVITATVEPNSWQEVGGPGSIGDFTSRSALVISQTGENHEAIADLLTKLREARKDIAEPKSASGPQLQRRVFTWMRGEDTAMPEIPPEDVQQVVVELTSPEVWNEEGAYIKAVPGRLIVRHRRAVIREIENVLQDLGLISAFGGGSSGPSGSGFF